MPTPTSSDVADWLLAEVQRVGFLEQDTAAFEIERRFGSEHVYTNENGNMAISRPVLSAFRKISNSEVVWERRERLWRKRDTFDGPGRLQD